MMAVGNKGIGYVLNYFRIGHGAFALSLILGWAAICSGQKLKSEMFLEQDAIPGNVAFGPPEYQIRPGPEGRRTFTPGDNLSPYFRHMILGGNFPRDGLDVPGYAHGIISPFSSSGDGGKGQAGAGGGEGFRRTHKRIMDPIASLVPNLYGAFKASMAMGGRGGTNDTGAFKTSIAGRSMDGGTGTDVETMNGTISGPGDFVKRLLECGRKILLCSLSSVFNVQCYLHCIFTAHPVGNEVMGSFTSLLYTMCKSMGTVFDEGLGIFTLHRSEIKKTGDFVNFFRSVPGAAGLGQVARLYSDALPSIIIKHLDSPQIQELKLTSQALLAALQSTTKQLSPYEIANNKVTNDACRFIDSMDPVQQLVGSIYKNSVYSDIVLQGAWLLRRLPSLLHVRPTRGVVNTINYAMFLLTGIKCDMIGYSLTGSAAACEVATEDIPTTSDEVLPDSGAPVVCGSTPHFASSAVDEIFPPVFEGTKKKGAAAAAASQRSSGTSGRSDLPGGQGGPGEEAKWGDMLKSDLTTNDD